MGPDPAAGPRPHLASLATASCLLVWLTPVLLTGCASRGGQVDATPEEVPPHIARIPDAVPKVEPLSRSGNPKSYVVFGKRYHTKRDRRGHVERGLASWYGRPFHGRKTSSGEIYDMHAMTAAHKTLPLPTYARVTNLENGRRVIVRINDRGPFHGGRIIDLSYTAAVKLGVTKKGTAMVEVRAIDPARRRADAGPFLAARPRTEAAARTDPAAARREETRTRPLDLVPASAPLAKPEAKGPPLETTVASQAPTPSDSLSGSRSATGRPESVSGQPLYLQIGAFGDPQNAERLRARLATTGVKDRIRILTSTADGSSLYKVRIGPLDSEQDAERLSRQLAALGVEPPRRVGN